jgi:hypothetical protein
MAKITITDLTTLVGAVNDINNKFQQIEDELNNKVLYRDNPVGEDNSLQDDVDFNNNDILNVNSIDATSMSIGGLDVAQLAFQANYYVAATQPAELSAGDLWYNLTDDKVGYYDGSSIVYFVDILDEFQDTYLGAKSSDPTVDNDGDALINGAMYFNTTSNLLKIYDSGTWHSFISSSGNAVIDGSITAENTITLQGSLPKIKIKNDTFAESNGLYTAEIQFTDLTNTLAGAVGFSNALTTDFYITNTTGESVKIRTGSTEAISVDSSGDVTLNDNLTVPGNITVTGTVDGRNVSTDGSKLDGIEANADVTDTANVQAAGALMDLEVLNLAQVKTFDSSDYATAAQGTTADNALARSGGTMTGSLTLNADPTSSLQAATKSYVDTIAAAGIHYHTPVRVESPTALTVTYDNGTDGVGATLTNAGTLEAITIDGIALSLNDRVLIYEQTDATQNGIYTVTTVGDGSTAWVLTRATDADSYGASDQDALGEGDAYFVKEGNTGAGELYVMNTSGTITFGTTDITFTQIAETAVYTAGTNITLDGTTFNVDDAFILNTGDTITGDFTLNGGNIVMTGSETVDGRDVSVDGAKLDGIEAGATADQTAGEIKTAYESNADTNAFTDAEQTKLSGIEASADVTDATNVEAAGALMDSEVTNLAQVKAFDSADYATAAQGTTADSAMQDLVDDTSPQLGGDLDSNGNNVTFGDTDKAIFGADNDLEISTGSYLSSTWGELHFDNQGYITCDGGSFTIKNGAGVIGSELMASFVPNGAAYLYYDNNSKFETSDTGVTVTGTAATDGVTVDGVDTRAHAMVMANLFG